MAETKVEYTPVEFKTMKVEDYLKAHPGAQVNGSGDVRVPVPLDLAQWVKNLGVEPPQERDERDQHIADLKERLMRVRHLVEKAKDKNTAIISLADLERALEG